MDLGTLKTLETLNVYGKEISMEPDNEIDTASNLLLLLLF